MILWDKRTLSSLSISNEIVASNHEPEWNALELGRKLTPDVLTNLLTTFLLFWPSRTSICDAEILPKCCVEKVKKCNTFTEFLLNLLNIMYLHTWSINVLSVLILISCQILVISSVFPNDEKERMKTTTIFFDFIYFEKQRRISSGLVKSSLKNNSLKILGSLIFLLPPLKGFFSAEDEVKANKFSWFLSSFRKQINSLYVKNYFAVLIKLKPDTYEYVF